MAQNGENYVCLILVGHVKYSTKIPAVYDQFYKDMYNQFIKQFLLVLNKILLLNLSLIRSNYWCVF